MATIIACVSLSSSSSLIIYLSVASSSLKPWGGSLLGVPDHHLVKNHTCVVKITHVWNLPLKKTYLKWLDKSTHVWEKPLSICVLTKWKKPNMCGFYQTHTKYKCVWKKPHMCVKRQTCVSFSIQEVVLFVFAIVFRIF